jgi:iron complex outermembrane receptor protein
MQSEMKAILLGGISFYAMMFASVASAQQVGAPAPSPSAAATPSKAAPSTSAIPTTTVEDVVVTAHTNRSNMAGGGMIAVQDIPVVRTTIGQGFIAKQLPISNALTALRLVPGADVGQDNPFGVSERSDLSVRGIDQSQMGFVLDGMPLGDPHNYLPDTNEWIDNENIQSVSLTQGTSELSSPVLSASGGLVEVETRDPSHQMGGTLSESGGNFHSSREFVRFETGDIGNTGLRAFASYSYVTADNDRGPGTSQRDHVDLEVLKDWNEGSRTALIITYNTLHDQRINIPNLSQFESGVGANFVSNYTFGKTNDYKFYLYPRDVFYVQLPSTINVNPNLTFQVTPYFRNIYSDGPGESDLSTSGLYYGNELQTGALDNVTYSSGGKFAAEARAQVWQQEGGINSSAKYTYGNQAFEVGYWFNYLSVHAVSNFNPVDQFGNINLNEFVTFSNGTKLESTNYAYDQDTSAFYASDTAKFLDDKLKVVFGVKVLIVNVTGNNYLPGATPVVGVTQSLLTPRLGSTYDFGAHSQVFFDIITNARPPAPGPTYFDVFNVSTGVKSTVGSTPNAEYSVAEEVGYRYQSFLNFSVAGFHNHLTNHQVNTIVNQNGVQTQSQIAAGGESIWGANVEVGTRPWHNISPYVSGQYLHAVTDSDLPVGNDFLPTAGKIAVRSPEFMGAAGLTYDNGPIFGVVTFKYVGSQYSTFMDDQKMPAYNQVDIGAGYRFPDYMIAKRPTIQFNVTNLGHGSYLGSVGSPTGNAVATIGTKGTLIAASQPGYYTAAATTIVLAIKSDF